MVSRDARDRREDEALKPLAIPFSLPMVAAIRDGRKTETRRLRLQWDRPAHSPGRLLYVTEHHWRRTEGGVAEVRYRDDGDPLRLDGLAAAAGFRKMPPRYMPKASSQITLEVVETWNEPLQAITASGAMAEGTPIPTDCCGQLMPAAKNCPACCGQPIVTADPRDCFAELWNSLHAAEGTQWADDPIVTAIRFRTILRPILEIEREMEIR